jgi:hypothetical protein
MNIYEKMLNITNEIASVNKNLTVGEGKNQYKAVGEADVLKAVKELEYKHKVYSYPVDREILESYMYTTSNQYGEKNNIFSRIKTTYRFVNIEKPEEYIETISFAEGIDSQDKGAGKAMTYSDKYALMKAYKIITGDDPDQNYSEDAKIEEYNTNKQVTDLQAKSIYRVLINKLKSNEAVITYLNDKFGIDNTSKLTVSQYVEITKELK